MNKKYIVCILCVTLGVFLIWMIFSRDKEGGEIVVVPDVRFSMSLKKDDFVKSISEKGPDEKIVRALMHKMPQEINISCIVEYVGENDLPLRVKSLQINGYEVPHQILNEISENYLDFSCSLVYN